MLQLLPLLRALNLYAHHAHNMCARVPFFQDHEVLAEIYAKADSDYDAVIERIIGTKGAEGLDLSMIVGAALQKLQTMPLGGQNSDMFQGILSMKMELVAQIEHLIKAGGLSQGTIQMLGDIADKEEVDLYKIKQRIKK